MTSYHYLADRTRPDDGCGFVNSAMFVRASPIDRLGPLAGHAILDPEIIVRHFFADLALAPAEARERTRWAQQQLGEAVRPADLRDTLWQLRRIKNAPRPPAWLVESGDLQPTPTLAEWLALRESLP